MLNADLANATSSAIYPGHRLPPRPRRREQRLRVGRSAFRPTDPGARILLLLTGDKARTEAPDRGSSPHLAFALPPPLSTTPTCLLTGLRGCSDYRTAIMCVDVTAIRMLCG